MDPLPLPSFDGGTVTGSISPIRWPGLRSLHVRGSAVRRSQVCADGSSRFVAKPIEAPVTEEAFLREPFDVRRRNLVRAFGAVIDARLWQQQSKNCPFTSPVMQPTLTPTSPIVKPSRRTQSGGSAVDIPLFDDVFAGRLAYISPRRQRPRSQATPKDLGHASGCITGTAWR
eukprot:TRINITY_DN21157_c0_g1_i1.p1 TRINITY_DN21157_c0_g1~~TRINITY_DN21157_c0_g1_i1.p1  ORF type:complete len:172 (+),score=24.56 TRINITY_DN21157_c0_g1_i1:167-682(+)